MDRLSPQQVAQALGTSRKRVMSAARELGLGERTANGWSTFDRDAEAQLRLRLGVRAPAAELSATQSRVLAALAKRPRGLVSRRAVARIAALSPTAASRAVDDLLVRGLVYERAETRALGRARRVNVIYANRDHPRWDSICHRIESIRPPSTTPPLESGLPERLRHAFWNLDHTAFKRLRADTDGSYIAARALSTADLELLGWAVEHLPAQAWETASQGRGRTPADRALALNIAAGRPHA